MMLDKIVAWLHFDQLGPRAFADIVVLAVIIYQLLRLIKGTRAVQVLLGIISLTVAYFVTGPGRALELPAVHWVLGGAIFFIPFAAVVLFQNHIRKLLSSFGSNPLRGLAPPVAGPERLAGEIALAVSALAARRYGALIIIEREQGLRTFIESGVEIDSQVTHDLLVTLFVPGSPLHDGAVIVSEGRLRAARCFVPLTSNPPLTREFGSRHRAAIGITEETDAISVVVSEERGTISIARQGALHEGVSADQVESALRGVFAPARGGLIARLPWTAEAAKGNR
jgi:diadenylate cyclase